MSDISKGQDRDRCSPNTLSLYRSFRHVSEEWVTSKGRRSDPSPDPTFTRYVVVIMNTRNELFERAFVLRTNTHTHKLLYPERYSGSELTSPISVHVNIT